MKTLLLLVFLSFLFILLLYTMVSVNRTVSSIVDIFEKEVHGAWDLVVETARVEKGDTSEAIIDIVIRNMGDREARIVSVELNNKTLTRDVEYTLSREILYPRSTCLIRITTHLSEPEPIVVSILTTRGRVNIVIINTCR